MLPRAPIPVNDPDGGPVTVTFISGELPPGISWNPDGTFSGVTTRIGVYVSVYEVCDDDDPQTCIEHTHTIAVTPTTLPGPGDDPDPDDPPPTLPFTGANSGEMVVVALMLLLIGASGYSYEEAAEKANVPLGTIKSRANRARQQLSETLGLAGGDPVELTDKSTQAVLSRLGIRSF